ncbi:hypothetical protein OVY29_11075 [Sphingopyxis sp. SE2]|uniref:hypothetical protein n=1 Tax=Sphingopyxis sp. SE2 TaxID=1586240 RepID=UPI0028C1BC64|nr:hypothetical protein [Sphingopyxis sp. SE2]MDT7529207.1 hypothetical protein [Sphingopyxis sp. SE2]
MIDLISRFVKRRKDRAQCGYDPAAVPFHIDSAPCLRDRLPKVRAVPEAALAFFSLLGSMPLASNALA